MTIFVWNPNDIVLSPWIPVLFLLSFLVYSFFLWWMFSLHFRIIGLIQSSQREWSFLTTWIKHWKKVSLNLNKIALDSEYLFVLLANCTVFQDIRIWPWLLPWYKMKVQGLCLHKRSAVVGNVMLFLQCNWYLVVVVSVFYRNTLL